jgi:hypothetical protein
MMNKNEYMFELDEEEEHLNSDDQWDLSGKNSRIDEFDAIELSEELGEMELKNFLYKR